MQAPLFVVAHALTRWTNLSPDGFTLYYQHAAGLSGRRDGRDLDVPGHPVGPHDDRERAAQRLVTDEDLTPVEQPAVGPLLDPGDAVPAGFIRPLPRDDRHG